MTESVDSASGSPSRMSFLTTPIRRIVVSNWFSLEHPTSMANLVVAPAPLDLAQEHVSTLAAAPEHRHPPDDAHVLHLRRVDLLDQRGCRAQQHVGRYVDELQKTAN